jgi:hypothetical protein
VDLSRLRDELPVSDLKQRFAFNEIPKLILIVVNVHGHATARVLLSASKHRQGSSGIFARKYAIGSRGWQSSLCFNDRRAELCGKRGKNGLHDVTAIQRWDDLLEVLSIYKSCLAKALLVSGVRGAPEASQRRDGTPVTDNAVLPKHR